MHGATLLDEEGKVLRPAILWNDGRCEAGVRMAASTSADLIAQTGNRALVGFTAPKLVWVKNHEPAVWAEVAKVLLPKDYVRWLMTGEAVAEMSDAAGMLLLDVAKRDWSDAMLAACDISRDHVGRLIEGSEVAGTLSAEAADLLGLPAGIPVVGGAGDQAAGAVGAGCVSPGQTTIALGTSGVVFTATAGYSPEPEGRLHTFCHAVPDTWHQMGVMLSAAGSLQWYRDTMYPEVEFADLVAEAADAPIGAEGLTFLALI